MRETKLGGPQIPSKFKMVGKIGTQFDPGVIKFKIFLQNFGLRTLPNKSENLIFAKCKSPTNDFKGFLQSVKTICRIAELAKKLRNSHFTIFGNFLIKFCGSQFEPWGHITEVRRPRP